MPVNAFGSVDRGTRGGSGLMGQRERVRVNAFGYRGILPNRASHNRELRARLTEDEEIAPSTSTAPPLPARSVKRGHVRQRM